MRLIAAIMTLVTLAASGLAGQMLHETLNATSTNGEAAQLARSNVIEPQPPSKPASPRRWPAVFGELQPPKPPAPAPVAPEPPAPLVERQPPRPPIDSLGYALKGVMRVNEDIWAMVSHPAQGERLFRVGQELADGALIERIDEKGLWVDNGEDDLVLLGFVEGKQPPR